MTLTPREIDAKLAEALGWRRIRPGLSAVFGDVMGDPPDAMLSECVPTFYSAPTWETSGQLIEGLQQLGWYCVLQSASPFENSANVKFFRPGQVIEHVGRSDSWPKAIAEAAWQAVRLEGAAPDGGGVTPEAGEG